ncbi:hypothetical protein HMPREF0542_10507 [Ligilactobacillus ruminis ATCC 25644]|uniref:Uncharacterized protein n=1 Tax=Ligilactobacillus ruminis ATCC 25644 TaxID=525362 RepID=E7FNN0_9LACO|nr:hypothetical protein HMPREF0542_10507 [Ligilactobacillus ruminis ATCC 25644]EGX97871.1 hypothetical protein ANHS_1632 [Ligilactobacillus ruminis ATCC 25644]
MINQILTAIWRSENFFARIAARCLHANKIKFKKIRPQYFEESIHPGKK